MRQIVFIHGGTTFSEYDDYLSYLKTKTIRLGRMTGQKIWFDNLKEDLGDNYEIVRLQMPNGTNANYHEWSLWFGRIAEELQDNCIIIGHSLGGIFLPKYLSEHDFPKKIRSSILVAAPYDDESDEDLTDFKITGSLAKFEHQGGEIIFYHGTDDIVPLHELESYKKALPSAEVHIESAPDHFMRESFPEIIERIKQLK